MIDENLARRCSACGHDAFPGFLRLANVSPLCWLLAAVVLAWGLLSEWRWLTFGAGGATILLLSLRLFGGVLWWGGNRCRGCGATEMLRSS